jgi:hypothetical protein
VLQQTRELDQLQDSKITIIYGTIIAHTTI